MNREDQRSSRRWEVVGGSSTQAVTIALPRAVVTEWALATFTKERMAEAALCVATVSLIGVVLFSLHRAMESYMIVGFAPLFNQ